MKKTVVWTAALVAATEGLLAEKETRPYREQTDVDVKSRAREFRQVGEGYTLQPHQVEYTICLLQRLDYGHDARASHKAFKDAWEAAYNA